MKICKRVREFLKRKYEKPGNRLFAHQRKKKINNDDFSIICNNCWGGYVYRFFGLPYMSPTVGLYINPKDYICFLSDIRGYLNTPLEFIKPEESKYFDDLKRKNQLHVPIGKIKDVEIVFLHYKTKNEAYEKWTRRAARVNYNNLIVKFSQMNNCGLQELAAFDRLNFKKMVMFVNKAEIADKFRTAIYFRGQEELEELNSDTTFFNTYINLYTLVNSQVFPEGHK